MARNAHIQQLRDIANLVVQLDPSDRNFDRLLADLKRRATLALSDGPLPAGNTTNLPFARQRAVEARRAKAKAYREKVLPIIANLKKKGVQSYFTLAANLNHLQVKSPMGRLWSAKMVQSIVERTFD